MGFKAVPLNMIQAPNYYKELKDNRWSITAPNAQSFWLQLNLTDELGQRRYIPSAGSSLQVEFQRSGEFSLQSNRKMMVDTRTIIKNASVNADDKSLWSFNLSESEIQGVVSGTVKFTLIESGANKVWVQNYFLKKDSTEAGF